MKKEDKPFVQTYLLTGIVCLCFLISGLLFVYFMTRQSAKESVSYLQNTAVQSRTVLYKQIIGDFQTLDGWRSAWKDGDGTRPKSPVLLRRSTTTIPSPAWAWLDLQGLH